MTRLIRRIAAAVAVAGLLFSQLAVSAYACDRDSAPVATAATVAQDDCERIANPALCERHCDYGSAVAGKAQVDAPAAQIVVSSPMTVEVAPDRAVSFPAMERRFLVSRSPPPLILFGTLRI